MRFELFDYQRTAAVDVLNRLGRGLADARNGDLSSFALSAATGGGKTVIATAAIEACLFGSADLGVSGDPSAVFLWITDDPALNRQTRNRMLEASELLAPKHLIELDDTFLETTLTPGHVYFLNTQKLSKTSRFVQGGTNLRELSFWEVLSKTVDAPDTTLYLILDEAHRGMKSAPDRTTIVQRLIHGEKGSNPPVSVVWGISATIDRFVKAMGETPDRTGYPHVAVDIEQIRASGLVKDEIGLEQPDEKGSFSTTLLRDAVRTTRDYEARWALYSEAEAEPTVLPLLVVQVPDKASAAKLAEMTAVIESEWPGLAPDAISHVFGEHEPVVLPSRTVEWSHPESIQTETQIRVVLAKEAISTGWDCPRAEVLYSERPATDATHIAQVIGRMVRQPLAHRIATDDVLNSVSCYLPLFDSKKLTAIKNELEGTGSDNGQNQVGSDVVRAPAVFDRNPNLPKEIFDFVQSLPSIPKPDPFASPLRRAKNLVRLLADTATGKALMADADARLTKTLNTRIDGLAAEHAEAVALGVADIRTADVRRLSVTSTGQDKGESVRQVATHAQDIDRDTRKTINAVKEGVGKAYYAYKADLVGDSVSRLDLRIKIAALFRIEGVLAEIDNAATKFVKELLSKFAVEIKNTTGSTRDSYRRVQEQTTKPEPLTVDLRQNERGPTKDRNGADLERFERHLFSDVEGEYPADLNPWEASVVRTELGRPSFEAWYRNPSRPMPNALRIAYEDAGSWGSLQVDFIIVSRRDDGTLAASIVDPHGDHLADAKAKLFALARFAEDYEDEFLRIESVAEGADGTLRALDLRDAHVREAVRTFEGAKVSALYDSPASRLYE